jgi:serine/threonine-protein kinase
MTDHDSNAMPTYANASPEDFATLAFQNSQGKVFQKNVFRTSTTFGSSEGCNIRLIGTSIDHVHATMTFDGREFRIWDLRTQAGTYVNGQKIINARLVTGDKIQIGKFEFVFSTNLVPRLHKGVFIDDYRVLGILGTGGMGWLYSVENYKTGERFAMKVLTRKGDGKIVSNNELRLRFLFEGKAGRMMEHPNIIQATAFQCREDIDFILFELFESLSLQELVEQEGGKISVGLTCHIIGQIALALDHIHKIGPVHRDVKPSNILVDRHCVAKLCDFGLVYLKSDPREEALAEKLAGDCLGTADFISPEQSLDSYHVDGRADIYSLGCTMYYALTGKLPFNGKNAKEKVIGHRTLQAEPIESLLPYIPEGVAHILRRAMDKNPEARYATAGDMAHALEYFAQIEPIEYDFAKVLRYRTEQARARLADINRLHHLQRIPPNMVVGPLDLMQTQSPLPHFASTVPHVTVPNAVHGDTVPAGADPQEWLKKVPPELRKLVLVWGDLPDEVRSQIQAMTEPITEFLE